MLDNAITPQSQLAIAIAALPGIARRTLHKLTHRLQNVTSSGDVHAMLEPFLRKEIAARTCFQTAWDHARRSADETINNANCINAVILSVLDPEFPSIVGSIPDAPFFLTFQGNAKLVRHGGCLDKWLGVAVIGTRHATQEGIDNTNWLIDKVASKCSDAVIISGLAEGIDIAAHRAALRAGLPTVALMGKDLRSVYPAKHKQDAHEIIEAGGALISEYLPLNPPQASPSQFVERDRLQAGFARSIVTMQCGKESGTMYAMHAAVEQGRKIYAFRFKNRELSLGSEALIEGNAFAGKAKYAKRIAAKAQPLASASDVFDLVRGLTSPPMKQSLATDPFGSTSPGKNQQLLFS